MFGFECYYIMVCFSDGLMVYDLALFCVAYWVVWCCNRESLLRLV